MGWRNAYWNLRISNTIRRTSKNVGVGRTRLWHLDFIKDGKVMLGMLKMLPIVIVLAGAGYAYHTSVVGQKNLAIAQLEKNNVILKENTIKLEAAFETSEKARVQSEQNLQKQLKVIGELSEKNNAMQTEMDDYLSIFKRHDLTKLAKAKPGLIQPRINNGTKEVFRAIEEASQEVENADSN